jgi:hypothetical protein
LQGISARLFLILCQASHPQTEVCPMPAGPSDEGSAVIATIQYELTDDRSAVDLLEWRVAQRSGRLSALGGIRPIVVLVGAAVQILIAIAAVLFFGGWQWI